MFCKQCGKELTDDATYCENCGNNTTNHIEPYPFPKETNVSFINVLFTVLSAIGGLYSFLTIFEEYGKTYTYTAPYTEHETTILVLAISSIIIFSYNLYRILKQK